MVRMANWYVSREPLMSNTGQRASSVRQAKCNAVRSSSLSCQTQRFDVRGFGITSTLQHGSLPRFLPTEDALESGGHARRPPADRSLVCGDLSRS